MTDLPLLLATLERARVWIGRVLKTATLDTWDRSTLGATVHLLDPASNRKLACALGDTEPAGDADGALREGRIR